MAPTAFTAQLTGIAEPLLLQYSQSESLGLSAKDKQTQRAGRIRKFFHPFWLNLSLPPYAIHQLPLAALEERLSSSGSSASHTTQLKQRTFWQITARLHLFFSLYNSFHQSCLAEQNPVLSFIVRLTINEHVSTAWVTDVCASASTVEPLPCSTHFYKALTSLSWNSA